jgi:RNA polymerase sigma factor (sigma-70 family)
MSLMHQTSDRTWPPRSGPAQECRACDDGRASTIRTSMQSTVESWFRMALRRWPSVNWPLERFGRHVGNSYPSYPEDYFLGGAASEHVEAAWAVIHGEFRPEVLRRVSSAGSRRATPEDLWSEALVRLMAEDPDGPELQDGRRARMIRRFRGDSPLPAFIAVVAKRYSVDLGRRKLAADRYHSAKSNAMSRHSASVDDVVMQRELAVRFAEEFRTAFSGLSPSRQALLSLVFGQRLPKSEAGRLLGMPDYKVSRELRSTMETLRERLESVNPGSWTLESLELWAGAWTQERFGGEGGSSDEA